MKTIRIRKYQDGQLEYIDPTDIFMYYPEGSEKGQYFYNFLIEVQKYVEYFNWNSSTAFGNPDHARFEGVVFGWCLGAQWQFDETEDELKISSLAGKTLMIIEKPKIPDAEKENRKDISEMWDELLI